jgi:hypothetical protein
MLREDGLYDLHRHPLPFFLFRYTTRLLRFCSMVQNDGPTSVARAFTAAYWRRLVVEAGIPLERISINWFFSIPLLRGGAESMTKRNATWQ